MSGVLNLLLAGAASAIKDAYYNLTTLLLNTSSTNGAQNNTFLDSSTNNFTITRNGNTTQGTFTPFSQTGWSNYFASSAALSVDYASGLQLQNTNWTIESYFNLSSTSAEFCLMGASNGGGGVPKYFMGGNWNTSFGYQANRATFFTYTAGGSRFIDAPFTWEVGRWYHMAAVYTHSNTTITLYIDGVSVGSIAYGIDNCTGNILIARNGEGGGTLNGYISNFRYIVGTSLYTSNFTPSTTPLTAITNTQILTCQSNRFIDNSSNSRTINIFAAGVSVQAFSPFAPTAAYDTAVVGGSGYFDGTGDYLVAPNDTVFDFGSGNFTIEFWVYSNGDNEYMPVEKTINGAFGSWYIQVTSGSLKWNCSSTGSSNDMFNSVNVGTVPTYAWTHIAIVRSGTTFTGYINGVGTSLGTSSSAIYNSSYGITVGAHNGTSSYDLNGHIAGLRLIKGTAAYTSNFTPPTAPPTAITNTSLLLNFTNTGIFDSTAKNVLETVGNAQVSTTQAKWGTTSMYFDGTGDYLKPYYPSPTNGTTFSFGTGDFTIEWWMYPTSAPSNGMIMDGRGSGASGDMWLINWVNGVISWYAGATLISSSTVSTNTWTHVAICRSGTSTKMFLNGTQTGSTYTDTKNYTVGNGWPTIGASYNAVEFFTGYLDDLRITKYARYTTNFTAPTAAFPLL